MPDTAPPTLAQARRAIDQAVARLDVARIRSTDHERAGIDAQLAKLNQAKVALNRSAQQGRALDEGAREPATVPPARMTVKTDAMPAYRYPATFDVAGRDGARALPGGRLMLAKLHGEGFDLVGGKFGRTPDIRNCFFEGPDIGREEASAQSEPCGAEVVHNSQGNRQFLVAHRILRTESIDHG
jgi:hypothetical protein